MPRKFLTDIDLNNNQLLNVIFQNVATLPPVVIDGKPLYDTANDIFYVGIGGVWTNLADRGIETIVGGNTNITVDITDPKNVTINIADANTSTSGLMSPAHFDLLQTATSDATGDALVVRDSAGSATFEAITINGTPTNPTDAATKQYVDNLTASGLNIKGTIDASTNPNYPAGEVGDAYHVSVAGKVGGASGLDVEIGDLIVVVTDNAGGTQAAVGSDWIIMQTNVDQATTTTRGTVRLATLAEVAAGTSVDTAVTPAGLAQELAALGTSDTQTALIGDGSALTYAVGHTLSSQFLNVQVFDAASNEICETDVTLTDASTVTIGVSTPPSVDGLRVVLTGSK